MSSIEGKIKGDLVALSENLANTQKVLLYLVQNNILSVEEMDIIKRKDPFEGNSELFLFLLKRNMDLIWESLKSILFLTGNGHLVDRIEPNRSSQNVTESPVAEDITMVGSHSILRLKDFDSFEVIGAGMFGAVMKARLIKNDKKYAIKITRENSHREIHCLLRSEHQNIVKFENAWREAITEDLLDLNYQFDDYIGLTIYCIQMELCSGRDLSSWILKPPVQKTKEDAQKICFQMSLGVQSLHSKNIIHRDLKPANILLLTKYRKGEDNIIVKIGDLGLSKQTYMESKASRKSLMTNCGTEHYMSPEQEMKGEYGVSTDIYSMALIFLEVLNSAIEKNDLRINDVRNAILPATFTQTYPLEAKLMEAMLSKNPKDRPDANSVTSQLTGLWYSNISGEAVSYREPTTSDIGIVTDIEKICPPCEEESFKDVEKVSIEKESENEVSIGETDEEVSLADVSEKQWDALAQYNSTESVYHLRSNLRGVAHTNEQLNQLAEILQNNPVALKIAYLTLNKRRCDMKAYLDRYVTLGKHEIIHEGDLLQIKYPSEFFWEVLEALENLSVPSYSAECKDSQITLKVSNTESLNELKIEFHSRDQLDSLTFKNIEIPKNIDILEIENPYNDLPAQTPEFPITKLIYHAEQITLINSTLVRNGKISPKVLKLVNIKIVENGEDLSEFDMTEFVDFERIQKLSVSDNLGKTKLTVDLSKLVEMDVLDLNCANIINWSNSTANIDKVTLKNFNLFEKTQMTIRELNVMSTVDPLCIPQSVEKLYLSDCVVESKESSGGRLDLPNLKRLSICWNQIAKFTNLVTFPNLETLIVSSSSSLNAATQKSLSWDFLKVSKKISRIRLDNIPDSFNGTGTKNCKLRTLILYACDLEKVHKISKNLLAEHVVIRFKHPIKSQNVDRVFQLFQNPRKRKTISVGEFDLSAKEYVDSNLKLYADRNAKSFTFVSNTEGSALDDEEFESMCVCP